MAFGARYARFELSAMRNNRDVIFLGRSSKHAVALRREILETDGLSTKISSWQRFASTRLQVYRPFSALPTVKSIVARGQTFARKRHAAARCSPICVEINIEAGLVLCFRPQSYPIRRIMRLLFSVCAVTRLNISKLSFIIFHVPIFQKVSR